MVDENNLFALIVSATNTADAIANDARQTASDREVARRIRDAIKVWKGTAFNFREWHPGAATK
ncbi:hypothetical protein [Cupriavidus campinensis]|uniref:Uncharacterized protein n=1 Tax=Cupriavidus campinensis TaxID=151783 RepID=A0AAE9I0J0_9BURK|nr:hypothetical protein [Cupriavidus campinensis]URF05267.1 hypothetical protein M5D45_05450 [Cupriavidus campinensis]